MTREEFEAKHGECIQDGSGWRFFPDGAKDECHAQGVHLEPNPDPHKRARAVEYYWRLKLGRVVDAFHELKAELESRLRSGGTLDREGLWRLKELKAEVLKVQECHAAAEAQVERLDGRGQGPERTIYDQQLEEAREKYAQELESLEI